MVAIVTSATEAQMVQLGQRRYEIDILRLTFLADQRTQFTIFFPLLDCPLDTGDVNVNMT